MARRKGTKGQTMNYNILHRKHKIEQYGPHKKTKGAFRCSGRVGILICMKQE
jgi:hypothetical protein